jgi:hypothetical protein
MALTTISLDIYCDSTHNGQPIYRVYVDGDLLTERTWIWPAYEVFIKENIEVDIESGEHRVTVENTNTVSNFSYKNLVVNGQPITSSSPWPDLTFTL